MIENLGIINDRSPHIIADLFEIICFFEKKEVSRGDVETYIARDGGAGLLEDLDAEGDGSSAEKNDKVQKLSEEVFSHLSYRRVAFGNWYPFEVEADVLTKKAALSDRMRIYAALLAYSRLKMFSRANRTLFAAQFEKLCLEAAKGLFAGWDVLHFGTGGADRKAFGSKLKIALRALAGRLKDDINESYLAEIKEQNTGDAGIDIVAYHDFGDPAKGITAYFGQCAARQTAWPDKHLEAHNVNLGKYFNQHHPSGNLLMIPLHFRNPDGRWVTAGDSYQSVLLDRLRLVQLLDRRGTVDAIAAAAATIPAGLVPQVVAA